MGQPAPVDVNEIRAEDILDAELVASTTVEEDEEKPADPVEPERKAEGTSQGNVTGASREVFNPQGIRGPRRGSPFAGGPARYTLQESPPPEQVPVAPLRANYPKNTAATGGAYGSLVMGAIAFAGAFAGPYFLVGRFVPICGIVTSVLGVGLGVWGISSERRGIAMLGAAICILLLVASCFWGLVDIYTQSYGYRPWETAPPVDY